jgi:hypothetical protein
MGARFAIAAALALHCEPARPPETPTTKMPPETSAPDLAAAHLAWERGAHKLEERRIGPRNLFDAWKSFTEARNELEPLQPRAALYIEAAKLAAECERELARVCDRLLFAAERLDRYGEHEKAQEAWRDVLLHFPGEDPSRCRAKAQANAAESEP